MGFGNASVWVSRAQADGTYTAPQLVVNNFGYDAGGWRVDQHPRFLADDRAAEPISWALATRGCLGVTSSGRWHYAPQLVVANFGYDAGGWRVDRHPRFLADTTNGRADIFEPAAPVFGCHELRRMARTPPRSWWSPTSAMTPGAGGLISIHGSWPTPPGTAEPISSASATRVCGYRALWLTVHLMHQDW